MSSWQNVFLDTLTVAATVLFSNMAGSNTLYLPLDRFYHRDSITTIHGVVTNVYRCGIEIKKIKSVWGLSKSASIRMVSPKFFTFFPGKSRNFSSM